MAVIRRNLLVFMQRLAKNTGLLPRSFTLKEVTQSGYSVAGGTYGDIYKGYVKDELVCLKVIRVFKPTQIDYTVEVSCNSESSMHRTR